MFFFYINRLTDDESLIVDECSSKKNMSCLLKDYLELPSIFVLFLF